MSGFSIPSISKIIINDGPNLDSFSRLRTSNPETLFDSKQILDNQPLFWDDQQVSGSGTTSTFLANQAASQLSVSANTAGTRIRQTFVRFNYQPGKSMNIFLTGILGEASAGIAKKIGYFDSDNGLFFQSSNNIISVVVRSKVTGTPSDTIISQNNWNLDKLDGTGSSGITLDITKTQIFIIDFQWLGVGRIRFGFDIDGIVIYVHQVLNANNLLSVYMSNPNLPLRYEISNDGTGTASDLTHICSSVIAEGGRQTSGSIKSIDRNNIGLTTLNDSNIYPLVAIRLKNNYQITTITELAFSIVTPSNNTYRYCVLLNPTIVGTPLSFTSIPNSSIEAQVNTTNLTTVTNGIQLASGYIRAGTQQGVLTSGQTTFSSADLRLGASIVGISDVIVLCAQTIVGGAETFYGSLSWREQI